MMRRNDSIALLAMAAALSAGAWCLHHDASMGQAGWATLAGLFVAGLVAVLLGRHQAWKVGSGLRNRFLSKTRRGRGAPPPEEFVPCPCLPISVTAMVLGLILVLGGWLRLTGTDWDAGQHLHPDERFLTMVTAAMSWPNSLTEYLDEAHSPLNPRNRGFDFFAYGTLPTTLVKGIACLTGNDSYDHIHLLGRRLSGMLEILLILMVFFIARRLYRDERLALLAAFLMTATVLPIQHAHFFVTDSWTVFFITFSIWALIGAQQTGRWRDFLLAGLGFGLALACKLSVYPFMLMFPAVALSLAVRRRQRIIPLLLKLGAAGIISFFAFRLGQPDAFQGPGLFGLIPAPRWLANLREVRGLVSGEIDAPPGHQWTMRTPMWFPWRNMVLWGLGPALGLAAWVGWASAGWCWFVKRERVHLLPVAWVALLFTHQGTQWVKAMRYQLPIYPMLVLLAAWGLIALWDAWPHHRRLVAALIATICLLTLGWALAFTAIYRQPHSRVAASRWMLTNIPAGSTLANEHWDDPLPLRVDGTDPFAHWYHGENLPWYDEDTPDKLERVLKQLDAADYIVLSSNRLSDSIPRLPMRYPMTVRYYEALQQGALGFEAAAEFTSYPTVFGLHIPDQAAEETFTVYDHPRVQIYRKTSNYTRARARELLGTINWDSIQRLTPREATAAPNGLMLPRERRVAPKPIIIANSPPPADGPALHHPLLLWIALLILLGTCGSCIFVVLLSGLPDRGWGLGRVAAWLAAGWLSWALSCWGGVAWTRQTIVLTTGSLTALALLMIWWRSSMLVAYLHNHWKIIGLQEGLFWGVLALFLAIRWQNPDLWHPVLGGEKPMDLAYLNAVLGTTCFPPANPWFAGGTMNYYYFGYVLVAALIKLTGITPAIAYNLVIPTLAALLATAACSVSMALVTPIRAGQFPRFHIAVGLIGAALATLVGNLGELRLLWHAWLRQPDVMQRPETWFWDPTRMITHWPGEAAPITEFPFFTYLFADLHPHAMALPLTLLAVGLGLALARSRGVLRWLTFSALALALGALGPTNAWDWPIYAALTAALLAIGHGLLIRPTRAALLGWALEVTALLILAKLLYLPYHIWFGAPYTTLELWRGSRTSLGDYLLIYGLFLWVLIPGLLAELKRLGRLQQWALALAGFGSAALAVSGFCLPGVLLALLVVVAVSALGRGVTRARQAVLVCVGLAFSLHLLVELVVLKGDISRMNTVFKLYLQSWLLLSVATPAIALHWLRQHPRNRFLRLAWWTGTVLLGVAALLYPVLAVPSRIASRLDSAITKGLDGDAWMANAMLEHNGLRFAVSGDLQAIEWLRGHVVGQPVIAEANTWPVLYGWGNRYSVHTGLPAVIGWDWHQRQQRAALPDNGVQQRIDDLRRMYETTDPAEALKVVRRYGIQMIIVGPLEQACYGKGIAGIAKFATLDGGPWRCVYRNEQVAIYQVTDEGTGLTRKISTAPASSR